MKNLSVDRKTSLTLGSNYVGDDFIETERDSQVFYLTRKKKQKKRKFGV